MASMTRKFTLLLMACLTVAVLGGCTEGQRQLEQDRLDFTQRMAELDALARSESQKLNFEMQQYFFDKLLAMKDQPKPEPEEPDQEEQPDDSKPPVIVSTSTTTITTVEGDEYILTFNDYSVNLTLEQFIQILQLPPIEPPVFEEPGEEPWIDEPWVEEPSAPPVVEPTGPEPVSVAETEAEQVPEDPGIKSDDEAGVGAGTEEEVALAESSSQDL